MTTTTRPECTWRIRGIVAGTCPRGDRCSFPPPRVPKIDHYERISIGWRNTTTSTEKQKKKWGCLVDKVTALPVGKGGTLLPLGNSLLHHRFRLVIDRMIRFILQHHMRRLSTKVRLILPVNEVERWRGGGRWKEERWSLIARGGRCTSRRLDHPSRKSFRQRWSLCASLYHFKDT